MTDPSLTLRTLRLTRGPRAPRWVYPSSFNFDQTTLAVTEMPMVGLIRSSDGERVAGRFFRSWKCGIRGRVRRRMCRRFLCASITIQR